MQRLLTEEEYQELTPKSQVKIREDALETARLLILELSNYACSSDDCGSCIIGSVRDRRLNPMDSSLICRKNRVYHK